MMILPFLAPNLPVMVVGNLIMLDGMITDIFDKDGDFEFDKTIWVDYLSDEEIKFIKKSLEDYPSAYGETENYEALAKSKNTDIRRMVAANGQCVDLLVNDSYWAVRFELVKIGLKLDVLVNDEDELVRDTAKEKLNS